jgi:hypothetical protein
MDSRMLAFTRKEGSMCFSATADFAGSAVLGTVGVATLREVKHPREMLFASMPLLFALHQFTEGFVWMGLNGTIPAMIAHHAAAAYALYAQGLLPFLLPLGVLLLEPTRFKQRQMLGFVVLGGVLMIYMLWGLIAYPLEISIQQHSVVYYNVVTTTTLTAMLYVLATCGSLFFSGFTELVVLAWANLIGLLVVMMVKRYAFTSIWCAYAAGVSVVIYVFFRRSRAVRLMMYDLLSVI